MTTCDTCQTQLLDYLYDVLDPAEQAEIREHLAHCPACQAALSRAERHQKLLARAAKSKFPALTFAPPNEKVPARPPEDVLPLRRHTSNWGVWAVAASLLLVAGGLGVPGIWAYMQQEGHEREVVLAQARRSQLEANFRQVRLDQDSKLEVLNREAQQKQELLQGLETATRQRFQEVRNRQVKLVVSGPDTLQAGALNSFDIQTLNPAGKPVNAQLNARVVDQDKRVVYEANNVESHGVHRIALPRDLSLRPESQFFLEVDAQRDGGPQDKVREKLSLAPPVLVTHLTTDKPMYRPGETVWFRSLTLDRFSLKPAAEELRLTYVLKRPNNQEQVVLQGSARLLTTQSGSSLQGPDGKPVEGVGCGALTLEPEAVGGEYTLIVRESNNRFPAQERKFLVNNYQLPRLNKELEFTKKTYGPGEVVLAACKVSRVEGGAPVANRPVEATILVDGERFGADGKPAASFPLTTDSAGAVNVRFQLPTRISRGDASLSVGFNDGGSVESIVRPIPIVLKRLEVEFYPVGGNLIAGVPNGLYFQARTMLGKPAELRGRIVDDLGQVVKEPVATANVPDQPALNQGIGVVERFIPQPGRRYELKIDSPAGIEGSFPLPAALEDGVAMEVPAPVVEPEKPIEVLVRSAKTDRTLRIGAYCRGRLMDHQSVVVKATETATVALKPGQDVAGVYRITVFEEVGMDGGERRLVPRAERLIYRKSAARLDLKLEPDHKQYVPGERATCSITACTEKSEASPAIVMVAVVDKSLLNLADEKTYRGMPTHFLLSSEVKRADDLEHADFLIGPHPQAWGGLDRLLATQGWRRFAEQDPEKFRRDQPEEADRLLLATGLRSGRRVDFLQTELQRVQEDAMAKRAKLHAELNEIQSRANAIRTVDATQQEIQRLEAAIAAARQQEVVAQHEIESMRNRLRGAAVPALGLGLAVLLGVGLIIGLVKGVRLGVPYFGLAGVCMLLLAGGLLVYPFMNDANPLSRTAGNEFAKVGAVLNERDEPRAMPKEAAPEPPMAAPAPLAPDGDRKEARARGLAENEALRAPGAPMGRGAGAEANRAGRMLGLAGKPQAVKALAAVPRPEQAQLFRRGPAGLADQNLAQLQLGAGRPAVGGIGRGFGGGGGRGAMPVDALMFDRELDATGIRRAKELEQKLAPIVIREYAHVRTHGATSDVRSDFVDTVLWHPALVLADGKGKVSFDLCDSVTSYQVTAYGHTLDGRLGAAITSLQARLPFTVEPALPLEVTASDKLAIPVALANNTNQPRQVSLGCVATGMTLAPGQKHDPTTLPAEGRGRQVFHLQPTLVEGQARLQFDGECSPFKDSVNRIVHVVPDGFPVNESRSDVLEGFARHEVTLPRDWITGTLRCQALVYPSTLASLQQGLEGLLREPNGCFEQTSTSNYPNLLVLDYLRESDQVRPDVEKRARDLLGRGYQKLLSFECQVPSQQNQRQGYEWFGGTSPPHEALTAYGLLQFRDLTRVQEVDKEMIERTRAYLLSRRDGKGGFLRNARALDSFGRAPDEVTNAYIVWALTESSKEDDVTKELAALLSQAKSSKDAYFLALVANSLLNRGQNEEAVGLLKTLASKQRPEGFVDGAGTSITASGGRDLQIETTALTILAWLKANRPEFTINLQNAVKWVGQQRGGHGSFGSTQSTILALKALIAFTKANKKTAEAGEVKLIAGTNPAAVLSFPAGAQDVLTVDLAEPEKLLKPGKNDVRVEITGKNVFPYTLTWSYRTRTPVSAEKPPVRLTPKLDKTTANEGETVRLTVGVENVSGKGQGMTVAIVGIPAGLTIPEDMKQLKEHARPRDDGAEPGRISFWEIRGRELILYWRDFAPGKKVEVPIDLICRVPGEFRGPASRAYLYYNADQKHWVEPLAVSIQPKAAP